MRWILSIGLLTLVLLAAGVVTFLLWPTDGAATNRAELSDLNAADPASEFDGAAGDRYAPDLDVVARQFLDGADDLPNTGSTVGEFDMESFPGMSPAEIADARRAESAAEDAGPAPVQVSATLQNAEPYRSAGSGTLLRMQTLNYVNNLNVQSGAAPAYGDNTVRMFRTGLHPDDVELRVFRLNKPAEQAAAVRSAFGDDAIRQYLEAQRILIAQGTAEDLDRIAEVIAEAAKSDVALRFVSAVDGAPIVGLSITVYRPDTGPARYVSDSAGEVVVQRLDPGVVPYRINSHEWADPLNAIGRSANNVRLEPRPNIAVRVVDAEGRPLMGARVRLDRSGAEGELLDATVSDYGRPPVAYTGGDGYARFQAVPFARAEASVDLDGYSAGGTATIARTEDGWAYYEPIVLTSMTTISGRVIDDRGQPVPDIKVATVDPAVTAQTDEDGRFIIRIEGSIQPGEDSEANPNEFTIRVDSDATVGYEEQFTTRREGASNLGLITLVRFHQAEIRLINDLTGEPIPIANAASDPNSRSYARLMIVQNDDGSFRAQTVRNPITYRPDESILVVSKVKPGTNETVTITVPGYEPAEVRLTQAINLGRPYDLRLIPIPAE